MPKMILKAARLVPAEWMVDDGNDDQVVGAIVGAVSCRPRGFLTVPLVDASSKSSAICVLPDYCTSTRRHSADPVIRCERQTLLLLLLRT
jgi:hypothetical protein